MQHPDDVGVEPSREGVGQHPNDGVAPAPVVDPQPVPGRGNELAFRLVDGGGVSRLPDLLDAFGFERGTGDPRRRRPGEPGRPGRGIEGLGVRPADDQRQGEVVAETLVHGGDDGPVAGEVKEDHGRGQPGVLDGVVGRDRIEEPGAADDAEEPARGFYRPFNPGDVDRPDAVRAPDRDRLPVDGGQQQGSEPFEEVLDFRETLPDFTVDVVAVHVGDDGSVVTVRTTFTVTQEGSFLGVPATGEEMGFRTTDVHKPGDDGGRVATTWHLEDFYGAYQQALDASEDQP